ncbi:MULTISPECIES: DEAD/DEAH box helicase [unclassified Bradyrhizobium]|uniref:DEAD/DEAH box helicase n=1 Tax=unclassified Bradyrhizobium TaxID=2631580 RepID=UPI001FF91113|nr:MULTISPECIES: DEAD/DEAH box helicase [unclassified Bradyrhizobium]MCK1707620.1 DEAD/DEAH box helicase [Bradyrhizobium sp. 143]MCK1724831.1 DEAD/DEAH box helicase [Bradyrhizobium sp. 142]
MGATLHPHQERALGSVRLAIKEGERRIMLMAPTGAGKTKTAGELIIEARAAGWRIAFVVPAISLVDQTIERFYADGIRDVGVIQADHHLTNYARPVQVASVQTLTRRKHFLDFDLVVIDEAHLQFDFVRNWLARPEMANIPVIGLSATPWSKGLGKIYKKLIIAATTSELIEAGYLSRFRVFAPSSPDLTDVRTLAGDYHEGDLSKAMDKSGLVADVVDTFKDRGRGRPALCFAVDRVHAKNLQQKFIAAGVVAEYIDAYTHANERTAIAKRFHAGEVEVVCNVGCLTTGIDWDVRCIILARPTKSEMLFVQMIGRGLRTAHGKGDCLILDHSDNHLRLGFVTDIHHDKLDDGRERQKQEAKPKEALPKKCPKCTFLKPPKMPICPACGFKPEPKCDVVNKDGELVEFKSRNAAKSGEQQEQIKFFCELRSIAQERSYKDGWAAQQHKVKFGHFPPWKWNDLPTLAPSTATRSWVKSRQIAFAKAKGSSSWR